MRFVWTHASRFKLDPRSLFKTSLGRLKKHFSLGRTGRQGIITVIFTDDARIRRLNARFRGKNKATDVLSFNYLPPEAFSLAHKEDLLGELYISVETARRQARKFLHPLSVELNKLFVHGFLHLHGYDHEKNEDYNAYA